MMNVEEDIKEIKEKVREIRAIIVGNGNIGLYSKVEIMWKVGVFVICGVGVQLFIIIRLIIQ